MQYLISGFMGCGKSVLLNKLAKTGPSEYQFFDLDHLIQEFEPYGNIEQIFSKHGEEFFRKLELKLLKNVKMAHKKSVLALGGGSINDLTLPSIETDHLIWLDCSFETCWKNIEGSSQVRPMIQNKDQAYELYQSRLPFYQKAKRTIEWEKYKDIDDWEMFISLLNGGVFP